MLAGQTLYQWDLLPSPNAELLTSTCRGQAAAFSLSLIFPHTLHAPTPLLPPALAAPWGHPVSSSLCAFRLLHFPLSGMLLPLTFSVQVPLVCSAVTLHTPAHPCTHHSHHQDLALLPTLLSMYLLICGLFPPNKMY